MMRGGVHLAAALAVCCSARAGDGTVTRTDPRWDATPRPTDSQHAGVPGPGARLPDLLRVTLSAWQSPTAATNPYNGSVVEEVSHAHLFRLDLVFDGLICPPAPLGDGETSPYNPFLYGPSPVYGFLEIDLDDDEDTGGELGPAAGTRYLSNIARFGRLPSGSTWERAARWGTDLLLPFGQEPNYRASGADFVLSLCGCFTPEIVSEDGNHDGRFDSGETWIIRGPFFQRAGGYRNASFCFGGASGEPGMYDPRVDLRFSHCTSTNQTTVSLVYALDMTGAGLLAGAAPQAINYSVADQTSIQEGLQDVVDAATWLPLSGPVWALAHRWQGRNVRNFLDPTAWRITALVGTASATLLDSPYIWTDTGFDEVAGDLNHDGIADAADKTILRRQIIALDAGPLDAEGPFLDNGQVRITAFGTNFCIYDINGDGLINDTDLNSYCTADFDGDGRLSVNDFGVFLNAFVAHDPRADMNRNGSFEITDIVTFGNLFAAGCP